MRLKGKGIVDAKTKQAGDQYVELKVVLPEKVDEDLKALVETWASKHDYDPRKAFKGEGAA